MNTKRSAILIIALCFLTAILLHRSRFSSQPQALNEAQPSEAVKDQKVTLPSTFNPSGFNTLSGFTENKGQIRDQFGEPNTEVKYLYEQAGFNVQLRESGFSYDVVREKNIDGQTYPAFHRIDIDFVGADRATIIEAEATGGIKNFRKGQADAEDAITGVQTFRKIIYQDLYPNIDLSFEIDSSGQMEYNFIVHGGGDPASIQMEYKGADQLELVDSKLRLGTQFGPLEEMIPKSWYEYEGQMEEVEVEYLALNDNIISFSAPAGQGDLVIDPVPVIEFQIDFKANSVQAMTLDNGYFILTGATYKTGFASAGAHKTYVGDGSDAFCSDNADDAYLIVFDGTGTKYWATYYGGGGNTCSSSGTINLWEQPWQDEGWAIANDGNGYIYFGGTTWSSSGIATNNAYDNSWNGGFDGFLVKFDLLSGERLWGTYLGGGKGVKDIVVSGSDVYVSAVNNASSRLYKFNADGSLIWEQDIAARINSMVYHDSYLYVAGMTSTSSGMTTGPYIHQAGYGGGGDGYVARYTPDGTLSWATYYGGSGRDEFTELQVHGSSYNTMLYLGGETGSSSGIATSGVHQGTLNGEQDAMLVAISAIGGSRVWGTYFGGEEKEWVGALVRQPDGSIVLGGSTTSTEGINSNPCNPQTTKPGSRISWENAFIASFSSNGAMEYGTYLPGGFTDPLINGYSDIEEIIMYQENMYLAFNEYGNGYFMKIREEDLAPELEVDFSNGYTIQENGKTIPAYDFGNNAQCYATQTFTIRNTGSTGCLALTGDPDLIQLSDEVNFRIISQDVPAGNRLFTGEEATFEIVFEPSAPGNFEAEVSIPNNDPDEGDYYLKVFGSSGAWNLEVSGNGNVIVNNDNTPDASDFTFLGSGVCESISKNFLIKNTGTACLDVQNITINSDDFTLSGTTSQEVGPGESFTLTVTAKPNFGSKAATVTIHSNDLDEPVFKFDVAVDFVPGIQVLHEGVPIANGDNTPSTADGTHFGIIEITDIVTQTFTIKNISDCTIQLNGNGGASPDLSFEALGWIVYQYEFVNVPAVSELAPGESIDFSVQFSPWATRPFSVDIVIYQGPAHDPDYRFTTAVIVGGDFPEPVLEDCPEDVQVNTTTSNTASWVPPVAYEGDNGEVQTGDIAFTNVSINPDGSGTFSFVALDTIPSGTFLKFDNRNWTKNGQFPNNGGDFLWKVTTDIPPGTVVDMTSTIILPGLSGWVFNNTTWGEWDLGYYGVINLESNDHLFAYVSDSDGNDNFLSEVSFEWLAAIEWAGGWDDDATSLSEKSALPEILEQTGNAISIDNMLMSYDCSLTDGSGLDISAALYNPANWVQNGSIINEYDCTFNLSSEYRIPIELTSDYEPGDIFPIGTATVTYSGQSVIGTPVECSFEVKLGECFPATDIVPGEIVWTGAIDTDWAKPCNWNRVRVPQADEKVIIPVVASNNYPVIAGEATIQSMHIEAGAQVLIAETGVLRVQGSEDYGILVQGKLENRGTLYVDDIATIAILVVNNDAGSFSEYASLGLLGNTIIGSQSEVGGGIWAADNSIFIVGNGIDGASETTFLSIDNVRLHALVLYGNIQWMLEGDGSLTRIEIGMQSPGGIGGTGIILSNSNGRSFHGFGGTLLINDLAPGYPAIDIRPLNTFKLYDGATLGINGARQGIENQGTFDNAGSTFISNISREAIANTGIFTSTGYLNVEGEVTGIANLAGTLDINQTIGEVAFDQNLDLSQNTLEIDVDGASFGLYDLLTTTGSLTLGGNLNLDINATPVLDKRIVFAQASAVNGTFNNPALPDRWSLDYSVPGEVALVHLIEPTALCQDITVDADANCSASVTAQQIDAGSTDPNAATLSFNLDQSGPFSLGSTPVVLTVSNGIASSTCEATITVVDRTAPTATCQDVTIQLGTDRTATLSAGQIDNGSSDNCSAVSLSIIEGVTSYGCEEVGASFSVTLQVTDEQELSSTCTATVTVADDDNPCNTAPVAVCQDITVATGANCVATVTPQDLDGGSSDVDEDPLRFTFDVEGPLAIGMHTATLTVSDGQESSSCTATITVTDQTAPTAICQDVTVQLDANGNGSTTAALVDNGSSDACGIATLALDVYDFTCADVGANPVVLTVTDVNGNSSTCDATVTVVDNVDPVAQCQNVTVQLDANGNGSTTAALVDNGSSDACGIASLALDKTSFDCSNVGPNTVTLTVKDVNGNVSSCTATVTVKDEVAPTALCLPLTVQLGANGQGSTSATAINNHSSDACGIASLALDKTSFDCSDVGLNTVTLTVTDNNGNQSTCTANVTVVDVTPPLVFCRDIRIQLDADGNATTNAQAISNGAGDNCGIDLTSLSIDKTEFDCSNVGPNKVTLTVADNNENQNTCTATVTVEDVTAPTAKCHDVTVQLDANGFGSITPADIDNGSSDACGILNMAIDIEQSSFDCSNVGENTVSLIVIDVNGNQSACTATVTVVDEEDPEITSCPSDIVVQLEPGSCDAPVTYDLPTFYDACGASMVQTEGLGTGERFPIGLTTETYLVTDVNGNTSTCTFTVNLISDQKDSDDDGIVNNCDNCPQIPNSEQVDADQDGIGDLCDNCPEDLNAEQTDTDGDMVGDLCDVCPDGDDRIDTDGDGIPDACDICPLGDNTIDTDGDGIPDACDSCPAGDNAIDTDGDGTPDACDICEGGDDTKDRDHDGVPNECDNCNLIYNPDQLDADGNGKGDVCEKRDGKPNSAITSPQTDLGQGATLAVFPNPFTEQLTLDYHLPQAGPVSISVFNLQGQMLGILYNGPMDSGLHRQQWNGTDESGAQLPSGLYLIQLRAGEELLNRKVLLQRY